MFINKQRSSLFFTKEEFFVKLSLNLLKIFKLHNKHSKDTFSRESAPNVPIMCAKAPVDVLKMFQ